MSKEEKPSEEQLVKFAIETFDKYIKNSLPEEYPEWVNAVLLTQGDGKIVRLQGHEKWVLGVYEAKRISKPKMSDSVH